MASAFIVLSETRASTIHRFVLVVLCAAFFTTIPNAFAQNIGDISPLSAIIQPSDELFGPHFVAPSLDMDEMSLGLTDDPYTSISLPSLDEILQQKEGSTALTRNARIKERLPRVCTTLTAPYDLVLRELCQR